MTDVDTSIYSRVGGGPLNSLNPSSLVDLVRGIQTLQGQQQTGRLLQQNTDEQGNFNAAGAQGGLGSINPLYAPKALSDFQTLQKQQQDIGIQQMDTANRVVGSTVLDPNDQALTNAYFAAGQALHIAPSAVKARMFPNGIPTDPKQRAAAVRDFAFQSLGPSKLFEQIPGTPVYQPGATQGAGTSQPLGGRAIQQTGGPNTAAPGGTSAPTSAPQAPAGSTVTTMPAGFDTDTKAYQGDLAREGNYANEVGVWNQALENLQKLGVGKTGPGAQGRQTFSSFVNTLSPRLAQWLPGVNAPDLTNFDKARKYLTQATQSQANRIGGTGSDYQLATTITGNPSVDIDHMAAEDVTKFSIAVRRMERAQTLAAAQLPAAPNGQINPEGGNRIGYIGRKGQMAGQFDPRAFTLDMLTPPNRDKLIDSLKPADRARFASSLRFGYQYGIIPKPGQ